MKKKILGLCFCMLLIATAVPAVTSFQHIPINATTLGTPLESAATSWMDDYKITTADGDVFDYFGHAVCIYYDLAVIGAYNDDNMTGSVYVYHQTGSTWTQQAKLLASDRAAGDRFGTSVDFDDEIIMIGAPGDEGYTGAVYVFRYMGSTWIEEQKLIAFDGAPGDNFGCAVSLDGDTVVIGASLDDDSRGSAYVYSWDGTSWIHIQKLYPSAAGEDNFGFSVSLLDDIALIGAPGEQLSTGYVYVFVHPGVDWLLQEKFTGSNNEAYTCFGFSISLDGDGENYTAVIGVPWDWELGDASGSAFVFTRNIYQEWEQQAKLLASDGGENNVFGYSVAFSGDTALIGANCDDNGVESGGVYVFTSDGTNWIEQQKLLASDGESGDSFGGAVSIEADHALIGAVGDDEQGYMSGSAYVFSREGAPNIQFDIKGGLGVNLKITNNGTVKSTVADWQINVKGGILGLINKTVNGTIDIPAGGSETVGTGIFFGLGPITITAKVTDEEKTAEGTQFIILSMVK